MFIVTKICLATAAIVIVCVASTPEATAQKLESFQQRAFYGDYAPLYANRNRWQQGGDRQRSASTRRRGKPAEIAAEPTSVARPVPVEAEKEKSGSASGTRLSMSAVNAQQPAAAYASSERPSYVAVSAAGEAPKYAKPELQALSGVQRTSAGQSGTATPAPVIAPVIVQAPEAPAAVNSGRDDASPRTCRKFVAAAGIMIDVDCNK